MSNEEIENEEEVVLADLPDDELVKQMHDDMYDGLAEEILEGTNILLGRGWSASRTLDEALVAGMTIVGIDFRDEDVLRPDAVKPRHRRSDPISELSGVRTGHVNLSVAAHVQSTSVHGTGRVARHTARRSEADGPQTGFVDTGVGTSGNGSLGFLPAVQPSAIELLPCDTVTTVWMPPRRR